MHIHVTRDDLRHGFLSARDCPLRHAIRRVANTNDVQVGFFHVWIDGRKHVLPQHISRWLLTGIAGYEVRPCQFTL
jgi:hypothetical protein